MPDAFGRTSRVSDPHEKSATARLKGKSSRAAENLKEQAAGLAQQGLEKIDKGLQTAAGMMQTAAATIDERADYLPDGPTARRIAYRAADTLGSGASYLRTHDTKSMLTSAVRTIKEHPATSLAAAAVAGFLVGCALRRD